MTMTDPIADMLSRVRNANNAHHETVSMPSSKIKANIAEILKQEGYIADYKVVAANAGFAAARGDVAADRGALGVFCSVAHVYLPVFPTLRRTCSPA